jgi:menaquinone-dependent protoporphyrinogen IX oxidase
MPNIAVIYKSRYGTTRRYAEWIAEALGAQLLEAIAVTPVQLAAFDGVIYGGGLYAGGIDGVKLVTKNPCRLLAVFTVGLAPPEATDYSAILQKNLSPELLAAVKVFHLRGGIDYTKLSRIHKWMMAAVRKFRLGKTDPAALTDDQKAFLETYGKQVDFCDKKSIEPIIAFVNARKG